MVDRQASQLGNLPGLAVAPPGLQCLHYGLELLLLDGGRSALKQPGRQFDLRALQQLTELTEFPDIWTYMHAHTRIHTNISIKSTIPNVIKFAISLIKVREAAWGMLK